MHSILLVDDCGFFREVGASLESRFPCRLLTAASGSEALAVARRERPDLIFLDAEMTGMTGIDVCRVLKADSQFAHTPVLGAGEGGREGEIRRAGAGDPLEKPPGDAAVHRSV